MEISKFRRKPKKPTIATDSDSLAPPDADSRATPPPPNNNTNAKANAPKQGLRKNAFRGLHLRNAVKRARSPAPPPPAPIATPPTTSHSHDGTFESQIPQPTSPVSMRNRDGQIVNSKGGLAKKAKMPAFLGQSSDDIDTKFQDMQWTERTRHSGPLAREADSNPDSMYKYAMYKQTDLRRGVMDRYTNIKPYNRTRVRLDVPDSTLDYVNASSIVLPPSLTSSSAPTSTPSQELPPLRYIAMQGPTDASVDFVWRMVAEQFDADKPVVVVQLTTMFENGFIKCYPYFPMSEEDEPWALNEDDGWGDGWNAELRFESMETLEDDAIELRKLVLRVNPPRKKADRDSSETPTDDENQEMRTSPEKPTQEGDSAAETEGESKELVVWHFLYTRWPDFGPPAEEDIDSFLSLMRLSREYALGSTAATANGNSNGDSNTDSVSANGNADVSKTTLATAEKQHKDLPPRIVHCSAGVGRTGTFIALEHLMRELDAGHLENYDTTAAAAAVPPLTRTSTSTTNGGLNGRRTNSPARGLSRSLSRSPARGSPARSVGVNDNVSAASHDRDLILQTVETLREQRPTMVQAPSQFHFLYDTLKSMWSAGYEGGAGPGGARGGAGGAGGGDAASEPDPDASGGEEPEPAAKRLEVGDPFVD